MCPPLHQGNGVQKLSFIDKKVLRYFVDPLIQIPGLVCFVEIKNIVLNLSAYSLISIPTVAEMLGFIYSRSTLTDFYISTVHKITKKQQYQNLLLVYDFMMRRESFYYLE